MWILFGVVMLQCSLGRQTGLREVTVNAHNREILIRLYESQYKDFIEAVLSL